MTSPFHYGLLWQTYDHIIHVAVIASLYYILQITGFQPACNFLQLTSLASNWSKEQSPFVVEMFGTKLVDLPPAYTCEAWASFSVCGWGAGVQLLQCSLLLDLFSSCMWFPLTYIPCTKLINGAISLCGWNVWHNLCESSSGLHLWNLLSVCGWEWMFCCGFCCFVGASKECVNTQWDCFLLTNIKQYPGCCTPHPIYKEESILWYPGPGSQKEV